MTSLRWWRGFLGTGLTWGVMWGAVFATIGLIVGIVDPDSIDPGEGPGRIAAIGALYGLVSGAVFSLILSIAERRRAIGELSLARTAVWGAVAAAVFPLLTPAANSMLVFLCPIGAALAAGSVTLAKRAVLRAPVEQPKLP
jgi:hypothetical protein